jgi:glucose dehydrogenase
MQSPPPLSVSVLPAPSFPFLRRGQDPNSSRWNELKPQRQNRDATRALLLVSGSLLSLAGAVIAVGGYLSPLNGSAFYMFVGLALLACGALVAKANRGAAWLGLAAFAAALSWALGHADAGASLASRLVGPGALLAALALLMPVLCGWRPRHALLAFAGTLAATIGLGLASWNGGPLSASATKLANFLDTKTNELSNEQRLTDELHPSFAHQLSRGD